MNTQTHHLRVLTHFPLQVLRGVGVPVKDLCAVGFSVPQLRTGGCSAEELTACGCECAALYQGGFGVKALKAVGFTGTQLCAANVPVSEMRSIGRFSAMELHKLGVSVVALKEGGTQQAARPIFATATAASGARALWHRPSRLPHLIHISSIFHPDLIQTSSRSAPRDRWSSAVSSLSHTAHFMHLHSHSGFPVRELKEQIGLSVPQLREAGFSADNLEDVGFTATQLREGGYPSKEIITT